MSAGNARATLADFDAWTVRVAQMAEIQPPDIAAAAGFLRRLDLNLWTADAIHIATAQRVGATLATFDEDMALSAEVLGLDVVTG